MCQIKSTCGSAVVQQLQTHMAQAEPVPWVERHQAAKLLERWHLWSHSSKMVVDADLQFKFSPQLHNGVNTFSIFMEWMVKEHRREKCVCIRVSVMLMLTFSRRRLVRWQVFEASLLCGEMMEKIPVHSDCSPSARLLDFLVGFEIQPTTSDSLTIKETICSTTIIKVMLMFQAIHCGEFTCCWEAKSHAHRLQCWVTISKCGAWCICVFKNSPDWPDC